MKFRLVAKAVLIMKFIAVLIVAACLQVTARGYGQGRISLHEKNAPILSVVKEIARQAGYKYILNEQWAGKMRPVTIDTNNITVEQALDKCFEGQQYTYSIFNNTIIVKERIAGNKELLANSFKIVKVQGIVYSEAGQPMPGANVIIQESGKGTITNAKGEFEILVPAASTLVISYIGFASQQIKVVDDKIVQVYLNVAKNELDKVVVQAYGTTSQRLATGDIGKVNSSEIEKQPIANPIQALQGQIPGVVVTNVSGFTSGTVKVEIRGKNTISGAFPSDPLYVVDGVPLTILNVNAAITNYSSGSAGMIQSGIQSPASGQSPLFSINPGDIESIEVLKDADATALYGSRASNGVILITTKKGKAGKTHADVSAYTGYSEIMRFYPMLNTQQYVAMRREALSNDRKPINMSTAPDLVAWDTTRYVNWQKELWKRNGRAVNAQASLSGGDARTSFRASTAYLYHRDILAVSGGNYRGSFSLNINHKSLNQKLGISWSNIYSVSKIDLTYLANASALPPNAPSIYDSKGNLNYSGWTPLASRYPFSGLLKPYTSASNLLNSNLTLSYEIAKGLVVRTSIGYNNSQTNQTQQIPIAALNPLTNPKGTSNFGYNYFHNIIIEPQVEYAKFLSEGKLTVLVGGTSQRNKTEGLQNNGTNYTNDLLLGSINNAPTKQVFDYFGEYKYAGIFARINYNWKDKFIINLNGRRDGSSRFGPGRQFGNFGSIGGAYLFGEEPFFKEKVPFLSFGKLRSSYGITGGDDIGDYSYLSLWQFGAGGTYNGSVPITSTGLSDSLLQWQVNRKLELAIDLGFFKDRLLVQGSWYRNLCDNQLVSFPLPAITGFQSVTSNSPAKVENTGLEFIISGRIIENQVVKLNAKINIGINRNKLLAYPNFELSPFLSSYVIGKPLNIVRYLHSTGVDPQTGAYTFADKNKDGKITNDLTGMTEDDRFVYDLSPRYDGGFTTNFSYSNFSLSVYFYFKKQLGYSAQNSLNHIPGTNYNQPAATIDHWKKPGDITEYGKLTTVYTTNIYNYFNYSDVNLSDASFIRLQNMQLAYEFPQKLKSKAGMNSFKVYFQGENLLLVTKYKGVDPEVQGFGAMPRPRILTVGLSCNF